MLVSAIQQHKSAILLTSVLKQLLICPPYFFSYSFQSKGFLKIYIYIGSPYHAHTQPFSGFPFYQNNIPNAFYDLLNIASLSNHSIRAQNFAPVFPSSWNVPPYYSFNCWFLLRLLTSVQILLSYRDLPWPCYLNSFPLSSIETCNLKPSQHLVWFFNSWHSG